MDIQTIIDNYKPWGEYFSDKPVDVSKLPIDKYWKKIVIDDNLKKYDEINKLLKKSIENDSNIKIFPYPDLVFNAFNFVKPKNVKVVFIGQDPYPNYQTINKTDIPDAMGLSFSVPIGSKIPSSLHNIFMNCIKFKHMKSYPPHGNLEKWAKQGCLFLNATLTVQHKQNNGHSKVWTDITDNIIKKISDENKLVIFVLWGKFALSKEKFIDTDKHVVVASSHPSGLSCYKKMENHPSFSELDQFGTINNILKNNKFKSIDWDLNT